MLETGRVSGTMRVLSWIGLVSGSLMVLIVNTFTVWLVLGVLSIVYLVYKIIVSKQQANKSFQKGISAPALIVILLSFFMILSGNFVSNITNNWFQINFEETKPSIGATIEVTRKALSENPILGYGPNRFEYAWQDFKPVGVNISNFWGVDFIFGYSYFLTVPASLGIIGILALLFFLVMLLWNSFKLLFKQGENSLTDNPNVSAAFAILFFVIVLAVHVPSFAIFGLGFVYLGLLIASLEREGLYRTVTMDIGSKPRIGFVYVFSVIVLMIASIYLIYITSRQFTSRIMVENANQNLIAGDTAKAERGLINAINVYSSDVNYRLLSDFYKIQISNLLNNSDANNEAVVERFRNLLSSSINASRGAIAFDSSNYQNFISLGSTYQQLIGLGVQGSYDQAKIEYQNALDRNPTNPGILLDMARSAFFAGNNDEAKELIGQSIAVKPNFVSIGKSERKENEGHVLYVGRLSTEKGVKVLLEAWEHVNGIPLKIIGDGPMANELKDFAQEKNLQQIEFLGHISDTLYSEYMRGAKVLIVPSLCYENFPRIIAEAFAYGIPVLASRLGSMQEIVREKETGLLFEPGNGQDLADKICWVMEHDEEYEQMKKNVCREYEEKYTSERIYLFLRKIYEQVIFNKKSSCRQENREANV